VFFFLQILLVCTFFLYIYILIFFLPIKTLNFYYQFMFVFVNYTMWNHQGWVYKINIIHFHI
jgi:hypothetical protein